MPHRLVLIINWWNDHICNFIAAILLAIITYFADIKGPIVVMFAAFCFDLLLGIIASRKIDKEKFKMDKFFVAIERIVIACLMIMLLFAMGKEMQIAVDLYKFAAWMVTGFIGYSAAENGYRLTGGKFFLAIKNIISKKVEENTGIDIDNEK